ncbi:MAG: NCS2 family permease [Firmicutes bacterium]|nr:NCS2 family permease [Bacillota bacterium]
MEDKSMSKFGEFLGYTPEKKTSVRVEIVAGIVTFLTMCYILTVNPNQILYSGVSDARWSSLFIATAFGAIIGTLLMAFLAKMPLAQASGMGLNSLLGSVIGGGVGAFAYHYEFTIGQAFMMVLISGIVFLLLSTISIKGKTFREMIFDGMPVAVRTAIPVGIGLFIAYIGFQNSGIIVGSQYTISDLIQFSKFDISVAAVAVCLVGLFLIAILDQLKIKGSVIIGILGASIVGIPLGITDLNILSGNEPGITWKFWENFANFFSVGENSVFGSFTTVFTEGFPAGSVFTVIMLIITMCMIDMFDTMGTIVGCCAGIDVLSDPETGKPHNYGRIMLADSIATCTGAMLGTSTVTTFVESGSGVAAGGRTGITALTVAVMFFLAIFALPVFAAIPSAASASALIYVGVLMMKSNVKNVDFSDAVNAVSAFLTIIIMVLGYSITDGIGIGMVTYTVLSVICYVCRIIGYACKKEKTYVNEEGETVAVEKPKFNVSIIAIIVTVLFLVYFLVPTVV